MKEFLSREGRTFVTKNVDEDPAAYDELLARGWRTIPITVIGESLIKGFDERALKDALTKASSGGP